VFDLATLAGLAILPEVGIVPGLATLTGLVILPELGMVNEFGVLPELAYRAQFETTDLLAPEASTARYPWKQLPASIEGPGN
jgi:hypothetical protein